MYTFVTFQLRCFSCGKKCSNSVALVIDLFCRSLTPKHDHNKDKPDMIRKFKRQPWPLSACTHAVYVPEPHTDWKTDGEKKRNLIELGTSIQFAWENAKHCDCMSWDAIEMKQHDKASTHRPSSPHGRNCCFIFFMLFGVICPSPLFNTTSSEFLTVPNNNLRGLRCLLRKGRPRRGSWCWWNRRVESCRIGGINIDHLKLSTGDAIQPRTNEDVKKTGQQSWS